MATMFNDLIAATEDAAVITGKITATDNDGVAVLLSYVLNVPAPEGLTFNADGSYQFNPSVASYQSLVEGQQLVLLRVSAQSLTWLSRSLVRMMHL
jgi:hypothetical protein